MSINWISKPWGKQRTIHICERIQIDEFEVLPGGYCTAHYHETKDNIFIVHAGDLQVHFLKNAPRPKNHTLVHQWRSCSGSTGAVLVPAGEIHRFVAKEKVSGIEIYRSLQSKRVEVDDIVRLEKKGGIDFARLL